MTGEVDEEYIRCRSHLRDLRECRRDVVLRRSLRCHTWIGTQQSYVDVLWTEKSTTCSANDGGNIGCILRRKPQSQLSRRICGRPDDDRVKPRRTCVGGLSVITPGHPDASRRKIVGAIPCESFQRIFITRNEEGVGDVNSQ